MANGDANYWMRYEWKRNRKGRNEWIRDEKVGRGMREKWKSMMRLFSIWLLPVMVISLWSFGHWCLSRSGTDACDVLFTVVQFHLAIYRIFQYPEH